MGWKEWTVIAVFYGIFFAGIAFGIWLWKVQT